MNLFNNLGYVTPESFEKLGRNDSNLEVIADLIRFNTLLSVARAGTGHLGASLSIVELLTEIYFRSFNFNSNARFSTDRDIFILSKGHAVPSLYSTLSAKGYFSIEEMDKLRRLGGLAGHSDISIAGAEANTGSLAMGLSKAVGFALSKKRFNHKGNVVVIVGDGELQEGQCWEAFLSAVSFKLDNLYIIIDDNQVQTDQFTKNIVNYGNLVAAFKDLGFHTVEDQASSIIKINKSLSRLKKLKSAPKLFYAHTFKGQGVSYMEHFNVLKSSTDRYIWHNKPPDKIQLKSAFEEIFSRINKTLKKHDFDWNFENSLINIPIEPMQTGIKGDNLINSFSKSLLKQAKKNSKIVVFDGDLEEDCGFIPFHNKFPERFFEMGIMEQHLVSTACAFSRSGYIPVISTYAAFLTSRANEQIYNMASERVKALIVGNMAGVIPATPGKSHQAFRDISCLKNIPGIVMYQPITTNDVENILDRYFQKKIAEILYLRLSMAASSKILPPPTGVLKKGVTHLIKKGTDAILIGIGPVVLGETVSAAEILAIEKISLEIRNHPWLIDFDKNDFLALSKRRLPLILVEDHYYKGGFGESLLSYLSLNNINFPKISHIALENFPQSGFRDESLKQFKLSKSSIVSKIKEILK